MMFTLGMVAGAAIALIGFVAFMAPKHWDWYQQNVELTRSLRLALEEAAHYKSMSYPSEWGPVAQHEARIVPKRHAWEGHDVDAGPIEFRFDDILDGGD